MILFKIVFGIFYEQGRWQFQDRKDRFLSPSGHRESSPTKESGMARMRLQKMGQDPNQDSPDYTTITAIQDVLIILVTSSAILGRMWPVLPWIR